MSKDVEHYVQQLGSTQMMEAFRRALHREQLLREQAAAAERQRRFFEGEFHKMSAEELLKFNGMRVVPKE